MSDAFRELLKLVGSGAHTSKHLTRAQAAAATAMMLQQEATPAQIGAFMIAHRIKRPTSEELVGLLDTYNRLGPNLTPIGAEPPIVFGIPYDGRSRSAPFAPLTALILTAAKYPAILHGGRRMPTKYGVPLVDLWQALGVDWTPLSLACTQQVFQQTRLGFVYQPQHFPLAEALVSYREQIGKRPPLATLELVWAPYRGEVLMVSGYVHPPTEERLQQTCLLEGGYRRLVTVKGLEGSCDLPRDRTGIICIHPMQPGLEPERLLSHPRDFGMDGSEIAVVPTAEWGDRIRAVLAGGGGEWQQAALWNGGFYLWQVGLCATLAEGIERAEALLSSGQVQQQLQRLQGAVERAKGAAEAALGGV
ncbi:anthranilate phosphoribosyltransferase family protein [Synechococcus sp. PCC 7336]|uniref:anthranilate phosphoribosyltransferase family protein n=1 Tax=Synechococcus sp. PCC 7336 TaxID=195250 RepID=UPI00034542D3|nr:anthranilate phosphoribosyltransferase family protein [Synechococcus sp. PCC 7336]